MTASDHHSPPISPTEDRRSTLADDLQDHALEPVPEARRKSLIQL